MLVEQIANKNQFEINLGNKRIFQSYKSIIAVIENGKVFLNDSKYNYSKTTSKHRNMFLNVTSKELKNNIKTGEYTLLSESEIENLVKG